MNVEDDVVYSEILQNNLIYVYPDSSIMRKHKVLIKNQCEQVCQNQITQFDILKNIEDFTFGFINVSTRAMIGSRKLNRFDSQSLNGFVFCRYLEKQRDILISIVCSRKNYKLGKKLMAAVEEEAIDLGVNRLTLHALAEEKLKRWYESLGFEVVDTSPIPYGPPGIKSYLMVKMLS
jgi:hypothetical protein